MFLVGWLVFHEEMGSALLLIRRGTDTDITLTPGEGAPFPRGLANGPAELTAFLDGRGHYMTKSLAQTFSGVVAA